MTAAECWLEVETRRISLTCAFDGKWRLMLLRRVAASYGISQADPQWFRDTRDWCGANGRAFFFKQWGKQNVGRLLDGREWNEFPA